MEMRPTFYYKDVLVKMGIQEFYKEKCEMTNKGGFSYDEKDEKNYLYVSGYLYAHVCVLHDCVRRIWNL